MRGGEGKTMTIIRPETHADIAAREKLLDSAFGECRFSKIAERLREGRLPAPGLSFVACDGGRVIGSVRLWNISAGRTRPALLLGPLAVACDKQRRGVGAAMVQHALAEAHRHGHGAVLLVGDAPYYGRFGFLAERTARLWLPGPYERGRLLGLELAAGALAGAQGVVGAAGRREPKPDLAALLTAPLTHGRTAATPRAA
jgi:predicted N-acetyltransferase YhbS